jgi:hypothetical protein
MDHAHTFANYESQTRRKFDRFRKKNDRFKFGGIRVVRLALPTAHLSNAPDAPISLRNCDKQIVLDAFATELIVQMCEFYILVYKNTTAVPRHRRLD